MTTSGSAIDFNDLSDEEYEKLYMGEWDGIDNELHPRKCKSCEIPLEKYGKHYTTNHGTYHIGWGTIGWLLSPDYNCCINCYTKKQRISWS